MRRKARIINSKGYVFSAFDSSRKNTSKEQSAASINGEDLCSNFNTDIYTCSVVQNICFGSFKQNTSTEKG